MALSNLGYLAIKIQSAAGTAVVPTHPLRYNSGDLLLEQDNIPLESIQNNAFPTGVVAGSHKASADFNMDFDANECVFPLYGALGTLTSSTDISSLTDASVYAHTINYGATPPSWSVEQARGNLSDTTNNRLNYEVRRAFGAVFDSWTLKGGNSGKLEMSVKMQALGIFHRAKLLANTAAGSSAVMNVDTVEGLVATTDSLNLYDDTPQNEVDAISALSVANKTYTIGTLAGTFTIANNAMAYLEPQSMSYSTAEQVMTMADVDYREGATYTAAASTTETNLENWEIEYSNNLDPRAGSLRKGPYVVAARKRGIRVKFTKYFESRRDADRYFNVEKRGMYFNITNNVIVSSTDTNNAKYGVLIKLSNMRLLSHKMNTNYGEAYAYDCEFIGLYDSSDSRAIQIVVTNAKIGTTYTA